MTLAVARLLPALAQQRDLLLAPDQRGQRGRAQGLEAIDAARCQHARDPHRLGEALEMLLAELDAVEQIADQPAGARADDERAGLGQTLQAGGEVGGLADHRLLLGRALADQVADHHDAGRDADPGRELDAGTRSQRGDRLDHREGGADRALGIALLGLRVAEERQHAIAHIFGEVTLEVLDHLRAAALIGGDDRPQIFGVELRRERGRADQIAEQHGQLSALDLAARRLRRARRLARVVPARKTRTAMSTEGGMWRIVPTAIRAALLQHGAAAHAETPAIGGGCGTTDRAVDAGRRGG